METLADSTVWKLWQTNLLIAYPLNSSESQWMVNTKLQDTHSNTNPSDDHCCCPYFMSLVSWYPNQQIPMPAFMNAFFITCLLYIEWCHNENLDCLPETSRSLPANQNYRKWTSFLPMPSLPWQEMSLLQNQNWKKTPKWCRNCITCSIQICLPCVSKLLTFPAMGINMENIRFSTTWKHPFVFKLTTNICVSSSLCPL